MAGLGRALLVLGLTVAAVGALLSLLGGWSPLGRMPGDILIRREGVTIYVPLASALVVSLVATVILNLWLRSGGR